MEIKTIAFIGTGVMGAPMAKHLSKQYTVNVYNRTYQKAARLACESIHVHDSIASCIKDADVIATMVGYPDDVKAVYDQIFNGSTTAKIAIDFTTSSPQLATQLYQRGQTKGISILDAPVSGGDIGAQNATLTIMVGGDKPAFDMVLPLFSLISKTQTYCGNAGAGQHMKAINQILVAGNIAATVEALTYAKDHDIDFDKLMAAVSAGAAGSWQLTNNGPKIHAHDDNPGFYIKHFIKDMKIVADNSITPLPILNQVCAMFAQLADQGLENLGTQALYHWYDQSHSNK